MSSTIKYRRDFLKKIGLGAAGFTVGVWENVQAQTNASGIPGTQKEVFSNGWNFDFNYEGDIFRGIGAVSVNGQLVRSGRLPMFAQITSPEAIELGNFKLINKHISNEEIVLEFSAQKRLENTMEWMLHTVRNRRNMVDWTQGVQDAPGTKLTMILKPVRRELGKILVTGFSYQYILKSDDLAIYKITDRSSWEIGGMAPGNEFWMRNGVIESKKLFSTSSEFYSTEWYLPHIANPNIFQFHPFQTHLQGFTFTSAKEGTLLSWATEVSHIRSLFEKWRGYNEIVHFHEHCSDLSNELRTSPVEVLWVPGGLGYTGRANLYNDMRELVHEQLHKQAGITRERITTYGIMEEWTEPDIDRYREKGLPKLIEAGVKTVFIPSQCQNDMNTWGVSNMCCNVDFKISETVGENKLKAFCSTAKANGVKVEMWGNTAISTLTERFMHLDGQQKGINFLPRSGSIAEVIEKAQSPFVRNASNAVEGDHYTPRFCVLNLRDKDIRAYWLKQWKYFHDEIGIEGIFLDSSFNMSSDKFHHAQWDASRDWGGATLDQNLGTDKFRPAIEPKKLIHSQYFAHLSLVSQMQKDGYRYSGEDLGVFGINRTGPQLANRISTFPIWADSYCDFDEQVASTAGVDAMELFFKGLAYRMMWKITWDIQRDKLILGTDNPLAYQLIKVYNKVDPFMFGREILADERAVLYHHENTSVLWAFHDFNYSSKGLKKVTNMLDNSTVSLIGNDRFSASKLTVYKIETS